MNHGWKSNNWRGAFSLLAALLCVAHAAPAPDASAELFTNALVRQIRISISPEDVTQLRNSPRQYVIATMQEGTNAFARVGIHLKGATGSFRGFDGKPAFTISLERFDASQRFHGLRKIHLNNSVEDPSYLNELLGGEMFRAAGVPASRVAHAVVELNGRRLGLYVLKEGFMEDFLGLYFRHTNGNLYDTGAGHDVNEELKKDLGPNPDDRSDLEALAMAAQERDLARRWQRLQRVLDIDHFLSFMALEIMLGHRDGYCLARNNFRVYHDVDAQRMVFFPHGMDVLFGNPRSVIEPRMNGLVAQAVMDTPEGRRAYRSRFALLRTNVLNVQKMSERIDQALPSLRAAVTSGEAAALTREAGLLKDRITSRARELEKMSQQTPLEMLRFTDGVAQLSGWQPVDVPKGGSMAQTNAGGKTALMIRAGPVTSASWRAKVLLPPGRYHFEGSIQVASVAPLNFGKNHGATLRVAGVSAARAAALLGEQPWKTLQVPFETAAREQEVDLVCDLRASKGTAWFDLESLRLVRER
jgi:hypothetical protein